MLAFDSVKARLEREQPMTFLEFNYMLMQSVDFLELERRNGCILQMGGSDQWGNIVNGVELIRRVDQKPAFGLTTPLLSTASGQKMGKTVGGAVWLNADMRSPYDYWQFWRNTEDADVGRFLRLFTDLPLDEIARLEGPARREINEAKKVLANEATRMLHGAAEAARAEEAARTAFEQGWRLRRPADARGGRARPGRRDHAGRPRRRRRPCRLEGRGAPAGPGRRPAGERQAGDGRQPHRHLRRPGRRRGEARRWQEEDRPRETRLTPPLARHGRACPGHP
jgi:hypothetical protein